MLNDLYILVKFIVSQKTIFMLSIMELKPIKNFSKGSRKVFRGQHETTEKEIHTFIQKFEGFFDHKSLTERLDMLRYERFDQADP